ncbi:MAG: hypothetical protein ACTHM7_03455 [Ginsengibacter sp.]
MLKNSFNTAWRNLMKYRRSNKALEFLKSTYAKFDKQNAAGFVFLDEAFAMQYEAEKIPCMMAICIAIMTVFAQAMKAAMANPVNSLRSE